ncbi:MAG: hypothetical protein HY858_10875 [Candidatus Solibacter usitatus]|nr:hypothetical protein [Candidatus Solibacter usitatus]
MGRFTPPPLARHLLLGLIAALAVAGLAILLNRGSQVRLDGKILKVRTIATDESDSIAVVDLRVSNPARTLFQVAAVQVEARLDGGRVEEGLSVPQLDLDRLLEYNKLAGPRYTEVLKERARIRGGERQDRTVAASFHISEKRLRERAGLELKIRDADGIVVVISERPAR